MSRGKRRPTPDTPALIDVRVLVVAALVSAPAAYRAAQGLLTPDQALGRFLVVLLGCTALMALLRATWPLVAGNPAGNPVGHPAGNPVGHPAGDPADAELPSEADPEVSPPPG